jgi:hypothetical protein
VCANRLKVTKACVDCTPIRNRVTLLALFRQFEKSLDDWKIELSFEEIRLEHTKTGNWAAMPVDTE